MKFLLTVSPQNNTPDHENKRNYRQLKKLSIAEQILLVSISQEMYRELFGEYAYNDVWV